MNRRGFLRLLAGAAVSAAAPTKTYAFFGGILRPRVKWGDLRYAKTWNWQFASSGPIYVIRGIDMDAIDVEIKAGRILDLRNWVKNDQA